MPKFRNSYIGHIHIVDDFGIANIRTQDARNRKERRIIAKYKRDAEKAAVDGKTKVS